MPEIKAGDIILFENDEFPVLGLLYKETDLFGYLVEDTQGVSFRSFQKDMHSKKIYVSSFTPSLNADTRVDWFHAALTNATVITKEEKEQALAFQNIRKEIFE